MSKRSKRRNRQQNKQRVIQSLTLPMSEQGRVVGDVDRSGFYASLFRFARQHNTKAPPRFERDTRCLDEWVRECVFDSQWLSGFVDQASMIHANRSYSITGGPTVLNRFRSMLAQSSHGEGFRYFVKMAAMQYYMSNFGSAIGLHRSNDNAFQFNADGTVDISFAPVDFVYNLDPMEFRPNLSQDPQDRTRFPYYYERDKIQAFDFLRVVSMPDSAIETFGIGRSAAYRCCQVMRITSAIYTHILGSLDPDTIKGIVTVKGYDETSYMQAAAAAEAEAENSGASADDILMLFNPDDDIEVRFQSLSRMPDSLNLEEWLRWSLTECAIQLGFPLEEFIGNNASSLLGQSGAEVETGAMRGSTKGGAEFINLFQEKLNTYVVPSTLQFDFYDRSLAEEQQEWELNRVKAEVVTMLYEAVQRHRAQEVSVDDDGNEDKGVTSVDELIDDIGLLSAEEARRWMVECGLAPEWLSDEEESIKVDDDENAQLRQWRNEARDNERVVAGAQISGNEPIIRYEVGPNSKPRVIRLFDSGDDLLSQSVWRGVTFEDKRIVRTTYDASQPKKKRELLADAESSSERGELLALWTDALTEQYASDDFTPLASLIDGATLGAILGAIASMGVRLAEEQLDSLVDDLSDDDQDAVNTMVSQWAENRAASLLGADLPHDVDDLYHPLVDSPLDDTSIDDMDDDADPVERAELITGQELITAFGFGHYAGGRGLGAMTKTLTFTTSQNPRQNHEQDVGLTIGIDEVFPNAGIFWAPGQVFGCKHGIDLG